MDNTIHKVANDSVKSVEPLAYINIRSNLDYKKQIPYEQLYYRNHFLDVFDLTEFDENTINKTMDKLYNDIKIHTRYNKELHSLLNRNTIMFDDKINNERDKENIALKFLFSYDTLDHISKYLHGYFYFDDDEWKKHKDILIENIMKEL
jgi:hypothetical protein